MAVSRCARRKPESPDDQFLAMLPTITRIARRAFRARNASDREELVCEAIASSFVQFCRLQDRGLSERAYATPLGHYGVRHANVGRRVGGRLNRNDPASPYCRRHRKVNLVQLTRASAAERSSWQEILVEDRNASPAQLAAVRIDFGDWLNRLPARERRLALYLAIGEPTCNAAVKFGITPGRVSQLRASLHRSWQEFQRDDVNEESESSHRPRERGADGLNAGRYSERGRKRSTI